MKLFSIDRIEYNRVICEDDQQKLWIFSQKYLPKGCREGDILVWEKRAWRIDKNLTFQRRNTNYKLQKHLFAQRPKDS